MVRLYSVVVLLLSVVCFRVPTVFSFGRLWDPPARSTMWRRGFDTPIKFNDESSPCRAGPEGPKCEVCGDPFETDPENEFGGKYATGKISNIYTQHESTEFVMNLSKHKTGDKFESGVPIALNYSVCFDFSILLSLCLM